MTARPGKRRVRGAQRCRGRVAFSPARRMVAGVLLAAACGGAPEEAGQEPGEVLETPDAAVAPTLTGEACEGVERLEAGTPAAEALVVGLLATEPALGAGGNWPGDVDVGAIVGVDGWYLAELRFEDVTRPGVWAVRRTEDGFAYAGAKWLGTAADPQLLRTALHAALSDAPAALVGCYEPGEWFAPPPVDRVPPETG